MRLLKFTALAGMSILLCSFFVGCGSDDATPTASTAYGDNDDPEFVVVQEEINGLLVEIVDDMLDGFDNLYVTPGDTISARADLAPTGLGPDPGLESGPDTLIAIYQNNWYYVYASRLGEVYRSRLWDSVQFRQDGVPQQGGSSADYVHFIDNWEITSLNQSITHTDFDGRNDYIIEGLDSSLAVINGTTEHNVNAVYIGTDTTMAYDYAFNSTATDIQIPKFVTGWVTACPQSGTIEMTVTQDYEWTNATTSGEGSVEWTINVEFDYGTVTVRANNGTTTWRYTCDICTVPGYDG